MTFSLRFNFFANARGVTFKDGGGVTWSFNNNTNEISATAGGGGGSGTVTSVAAGSAHIVIGGTPTVAPTVDLSAADKTSLALANTALQTAVTSVGLTVNATYITIGGASSPITTTGTFTLDLSAAAKTSLGKADTALQTAVTSVALADGSGTAIYAISGSPVTTTGTLTFTLNTQTAAKVFAGPTSGGAAQPTFRSLATTDIPALPYVTSVALADGSTVPIYTISGSPVTSSGTLTHTLTTQTANKVFAGPVSGGAAQPTFRSLVIADGLFSNTQTFLQGGGTSQTYTVPVGCTKVEVICVGGGGGGGSGAIVASGTTASGGGGGGGGGISLGVFRAADLGPTVTITFTSTTGGAGGAAVTVAGSGNNGTAGSDVTFGKYLAAKGATAGGKGNVSASSTTGVGTVIANHQSGTNGAADTAAAAGGAGVAAGTAISGFTMNGGLGAGAGGGLAAVPVSLVGGAGGGSGGLATSQITNLGTAAGGTVGGGAGGVGGSGSGTTGGAGGGGGGSAIGATVGGAGGNGGDMGGGGGGGGASLSTSAHSGAGGNGGAAAVICIAW